MPFRDLSGGKGSIGEAIRETVTTDLKDVGGLRVIERANLDKVLAEQNLQSKKDNLDPLSSVKIGKLLGATLIVAGAYQKAASSVRLTARFVSVETGEIVGTAKVDGPQADFLTLQDKVTTQLLKSAGIEQKHVQVFAARRRPKVKSLHTIELYGDAVVETDDTKKKALLEEAVKIDPGFVYASRDLDALEKRMRGYAAIAQVAQTAKMKAELAKIETQLKTETDPMKIYMYYTQLFAQLMINGRYRTLIVVCQKVVAHPPPTPPQMAMAGSLDEQAQMWLVRSYEQLKDDDDMLREGEKFMQKYPTSAQFNVMQMLLNAAIDRKRAHEEGVQKARDEIARLPPQQQNDPCRLGTVYKSQHQNPEALKAFEACQQRGGDPRLPWLAAFDLVWVNYEMGRTTEARKWITFLRDNFPEQYRNVRHLETMMPREE
jgi:TolB-like protein/tetratricopeptide (TPR) repeat protein